MAPPLLSYDACVTIPALNRRVTTWPYGMPMVAFIVLILAVALACVTISPSSSWIHSARLSHRAISSSVMGTITAVTSYHASDAHPGAMASTESRISQPTHRSQLLVSPLHGVKITVPALLVISTAALAALLFLGKLFQRPLRHLQRTTWITLNAIGADETDIDELIMKMRQAPHADLERLIDRNISSLDAPFFTRIAQLIKEAPSIAERAQLEAFSRLVKDNIENMFNSKLYAITMPKEMKMVFQLTDLLREESGDVLFPVSKERLNAVRQAIQKDFPAYYEDGFIRTAKGMTQDVPDGEEDSLFDELIYIVLQVLSTHALIALCRGLSPAKWSPVMIEFLVKLLQEPVSEWVDMIQASFFSEDAALDPEVFEDMLTTSDGILSGLTVGSELHILCEEFVLSVVTALRMAESDTGAIEI